MVYTRVGRLERGNISTRAQHIYANQHKSKFIKPLYYLFPDLSMEYFHYLIQYQLAVCKECQYVIWLDQIKGHLHGKHHKMPWKKVHKVVEEVHGWPGLIPFASELKVPIRINQPIPNTLTPAPYWVPLHIGNLDFLGGTPLMFRGDPTNVTGGVVFHGRFI